LQADGALDASFQSVEDADHRAAVVAAGAEAWRLDESVTRDALLRGFFCFYADEFRWGEEVVSVRCGRRLLLTEPCFARLQPCRDEGSGPRMRIEDPFIVTRNLCDVMSVANDQKLRSALRTGWQDFKGGRWRAVLGDIGGASTVKGKAGGASPAAAGDAKGGPGAPGVVKASGKASGKEAAAKGGAQGAKGVGGKALTKGAAQPIGKAAGAKKGADQDSTDKAKMWSADGKVQWQ